jgi:hypothetical protein
LVRNNHHTSRGAYQAGRRSRSITHERVHRSSSALSS